MPFQNYVASPFSELSIRRFAPDCAGIYALSNAREWVFVGQADNIKAALLTHLQEADSAIGRRAPTGFAFEACSPDARFTRFERMILELEPVCNRSGPAARTARAT